MSVFRDFQSAWAVRFPGCELPRAWEEDVRSNLDKHRSRVALLKEELEKEEFYVEYLERLLSDVEKGRQQSSTKSSSVNKSGLPPKASPRTSTANNSRTNSVSSVVSRESASSDEQFVTVINVSSSSPSSKEKNGSVSLNKSHDNPLYQDSLASRRHPSLRNNKASLTTDDQELKDSRVDESSSKAKCSETTKVNSIRNGKSSSPSCPSATTASSVVILSKAVSSSASSANGNKTVNSSNGNGGLVIRKLCNKVSNGSSNLNNNNVDLASSRKRPPTPPRKPKINPQNFPGLQFMGKEGFGVADNLSTPPNSVPVSPTDGLESREAASPSSPTHESSFNNNACNNNHIKDSHSPAQVSSPSLTKDSKQPLITACKVVDLIGSCERKSSVSDIPAPIDSDTPLLRVLSEIERGSNQSLGSADLDEGDFNPIEEALRDALLKADEERSINEDLSLQDALTEHLEDEDDLENQEGIYDTVAPDEAPDEESDETRLTSSSHDKLLVLKSANECHSLDRSGDLLERRSSGSNLSVTTSNLASSSGPASTGLDNFSNYVNIDYFLRNREETSSKNDSDDNDTQFSRSVCSDHEIDEDGKSVESRDVTAKLSTGLLHHQPTYDQVFHDPDLYGAYYGVPESDSAAESGHHDEQKSTKKPTEKSSGVKTSEEESKAEAERLMMYKCIISSITESEALYVDCLNTLLQYMKAIKSTIGTTHPLVSPEDLSVMFYKIPELHAIHAQFVDGLKKLQSQDDSTTPVNKTSSSERIYEETPSLGDLFKTLASRLGAYSAYLKNYSRALETVQKCSSENTQFSEITRAIKLKSMKGQAVTLEELLHKPVARVQKNALVLHDLLKYTAVTSEDFKSLNSALKMTQSFLNDLNIAATEQMFPVQDKTQRRLVKESFIIEGIEGKRKLRHLFLFNDIIVCAKYKPSTRQKFTFDVKWYALLSDLTLPETEDSAATSMREKETNTEIMALKTKVSTLRDEMLKERGSKGNSKALEKLKKKQVDLEGQLVLLLPQLPFNMQTKGGKTSYFFFLSSEYEKTQWIEAIKVLQQTIASSMITSHTESSSHININELQAWIETCRKGLNPNLGSFLLRSIKDEDLLHGDLYLEINSLKGLSRPADLFFVIEVDIYGHFFQKSTTKVAREATELRYDQEFVIDLDGSQTLRILCYEQVPGIAAPLFRGRASIELSRSWLTDSLVARDVSMLDSILSVKLKYVSSESSNIRFPAGKVFGSFGISIQTVCKKEKSQIPFLIIGCVREVERRGLKEQGIYRVSGLNSDVQKLKKAFENNPYEAEHLLKDIDIHSVTGLLKMYLRELPEALFTSQLYKKFFEAFNLSSTEDKKKKYLALFTQLPTVNQNTINFLIDHLAKVNQFESHNKMSLHNLATVFGPTMIRPSPSASVSNADSFTAGTIDVMAQAGILYFFLKKKVTPSEGTPL